MHPRPFTHAQQAQRVGMVNFVLGNAPPIVLYNQLQRGRITAQINRYLACLRMAGNIPFGLSVVGFDLFNRRPDIETPLQ